MAPCCSADHFVVDLCSKTALVKYTLTERQRHRNTLLAAQTLTVGREAQRKAPHMHTGPDTHRCFICKRVIQTNHFILCLFVTSCLLKPISPFFFLFLSLSNVIEAVMYPVFLIQSQSYPALSCCFLWLPANILTLCFCFPLHTLCYTLPSPCPHLLYDRFPFSTLLL